MFWVGALSYTTPNQGLIEIPGTKEQRQASIAPFKGLHVFS
jgi:hypothetical protein